MSAPAQEVEKLAEVTAEVATVVEQARAIDVRTPDEASFATAFLSRIATAKRQGEAARRFLVDPLNEHVKRINAQFKETAAPLDEADQVVRQKVLTYQREAQRQAAEEQARLDAERRAAEEAAEAERRRLAEEAARAERNAAEAEARRREEMAAARSERRREIGDMSDEQLAELAASPDAPVEDGNMAVEEIQSRKNAREAQEAAAKARQEAEEAQQREIAAKSAPAMAVAAPAPLAAANGSASVRKEWKVVEIVDEKLLPREYWLIDHAKLNKVVKAGVREIPGVRIEQAEGLSVRAAR